MIRGVVCLKRDSVGVFIDGDYLDGILRSEFESTRMDFMTFSQIIIPEGSHRFRTYYYKSVPYLGSETSDEERYRSEGVEKFLQSLRHLPRFKVRLGELNRSPDGQFKRKGLAVSMTVDVIRLSSERIIDNIFLVCADPEVLPMISAARDMGAIVRLYHGENVPERMLAEVDESVRIDADIVSRCMRPSADNGR